MTDLGLDTDAGDPRRPFIIVHLMKTGGFSLLYQVMANVPRAATWGIPDEEVDDLTRMSHYSSVEELRMLDAETRSRLEVVMGHLPFAVADLAGFDQAPVATVVREPVDRVISYLSMCRTANPEHRDLPLEQIYEDEFFGPRTICNHQTKMLGMTTAQATTAPPDPDGAPDPAIVEALAAEGYFESAPFVEDAGSGRLALEAVDTPLVWPVAVDGCTLANARRNLDRVEVLGIHEEYDDFLDRLGDRMGWIMDRDIRANRGAAVEVSASFRRRIEEGNSLDLELYERACELVHQT